MSENGAKEVNSREELAVVARRPFYWRGWMDYGVSAVAIALLIPVIRQCVWGFTDVFGVGMRLMIVFLGSALSLPIAMSLSLNFKSSVTLRVAVQVILLAVCLAPVAFWEESRMSEARRRETFGNAEVVIAAVKDYQMQHGRFPDTLEALGSALPGPASGWHFEYELHSKGFTLLVIGGFHWKQYISWADAWTNF